MKTISNFRKSLFTLLTGSAFSQIILFGSSPLLTRLYEPSAFGQYAILSLFISLIVVFATGKYDIAIQLPKSNEDASALVWLATTISICVTVIIVSILMIGYKTSGNAIWNVIGLDSPDFGIVFVLLVGASIFLTACQSTFFVWMNRQGAFKSISLARIVQAIVMVSIQILFSFLYRGVFGLLCGTVIGLASCLLFQLYFMLIERELLLRPKLLHISRVAAEYSNLPRHMILTDLIGVLLSQFPVYFLGLRFSDTAVGYFSLAQRVLLAPMQLIGSSIGEVFRRMASEQYGKSGECKSIFMKIALALGGASIIAITITTLFAPNLFAFFFGEKWRTAGEYSAILIVMFSLKFVVNPLSFMFIIAKKTKIDLLLHFIFLVLLALIFYQVDSINLTVEKALYIFVSIYSAMYVTYFLLSMRYAKGA